MEDEFRTLREDFAVYQNLYEKEGNADEKEKALSKVINTLVNDLKFSPRDLSFTLGVEPLTILRWRSGDRSMKADIYSTFKSFIEDTLEGLPQKPIRVSDTGIRSWQYVFQKRQRHAKRTWTISEGSLILATSHMVRENAVDIFDADEQEKRASLGITQEVIIPRSIYIFPENSLTEQHLNQWLGLLDAIRHKRKLRGMVLGIKLPNKVSLPWFLPGIRAVILEMADGKSFEGYIRFTLSSHNEQALFQALGVVGDTKAQLPWMRVDTPVADPWLFEIKRQFLECVQIEEEKMNGGFHAGVITPSIKS